jgi:hypothetical protein
MSTRPQAGGVGDGFFAEAHYVSAIGHWAWLNLRQRIIAYVDKAGVQGHLSHAVVTQKLVGGDITA